jgi:peroxiredoxin
VAQLCQKQEELERLNTEVLVISFGQQEEARDWSREVCLAFQLLLDPERKVYRSYNLRRSWLSSWNLKTLGFYIKALLGGTEWRGIHGDSAQLGGDFIIARDGTFLLKHPSQEATDRPGVSEILKILRENCR